MKKIEKDEISVYEEQKTSIENMIMSAIKSNVPAETMERFLAMRRELKAEYAKEQFDKSMAEFQGKCPVIERKKQGNNYKYAPLEDIILQTKTILAQCGFSYRIESDMENDKIKAICIAIHKNGHTERSSFVAPSERIISKSGSLVRTAMQDSASSLTFAKRYAFCNVFGIMTGDEDNNRALVPIDNEKKEKLLEKIEKCMTVDQLKLLWSSMQKEEKANKDIITAFSTIKSNIINEEKNNNN